MSLRNAGEALKSGQPLAKRLRNSNEERIGHLVRPEEEKMHVIAVSQSILGVLRGEESWTRPWMPLRLNIRLLLEPS
ncbi:hypothetical protein T265_10117 [Opisthorchis viverrini]|uniref:Uncharacterized protein n=1 Tax=Opisthorchis viverrini TaxID=6198 RepID=A0A074ZEE0_OPIVI|nr:hypothetical protein T265_10117 [Opisthorchis viverrini]KER21580.1 hypothetical protein T265_10117 [Opisthorchis viverrini]